MIREILFDLRRQRSLKIAVVLILLIFVAVVAVNVFAGIYALIFDAVLIIAGILISLACDIITSPPFVRRKHTPVPFRAGEAEGGKLEIIDGIPILSLRGTNRRMGRQAGTLIRDQLHVLVRDFLNYVFRNPAKKKTAMEHARSLERFIPPQYLEELRGMSETSGVPYEELLLANTFTEDYRIFLCSTLTVRGAASADGRLIMGRNLDFISVGVLQHYNMVTVYHPENGGAFAAMTYPGFVGVVTGMNSRGLTSAMLISFSGGFSAERVPSTIAFRMMLERCGTVGEAAKFLSENPIAGPFNLSLADAAGGMCVAEMAHDHFALRQPQDDVLICTNRFHGGEYSRNRPDYRTCRMRKMVKKERGKFDVERIQRVMSKVYLLFLNLQSMVILPEERALYFSSGKIPAAKGHFKRLDLNAYF
jgi:predicted choloylglycine hydrolase